MTDETLPRVTAILFCQALRERPGAPDILGVFTWINATTFPTTVAPFCVYLQLAEGFGKFTIEVQIRDPLDETILAVSDAYEINLQDNWSVLHAPIATPEIEFNHAGKFDVVVLANAQIVGRQSLLIVTKVSPTRKKRKR